MRTTLFGLQDIARKAAIATSTAGLVVGTALPAFAVPTSVSLSLGDARVNETSTYTLDMSTVDTTTSLQCIEVDINTSADGTGSVPAGLATTSSSFDGSSLITPASWTVDNTTNGKLRITNTTGETPSAAGNVVWGAVTNGSSAEVTYYGIISTYTNDDCTGLNESVVVTLTYTNGQLVEVTVDPSLTFDVAGVSSGDATGDDTTTVASTDGNVPFGSVTTGTNGVAGHDLSVATNASGGFDVFVRHTGALLNQSDGTSTITDHDGTNAAPTVLDGGEEFGYHTSGMPQFAAGEYAGFTSSNQVVMNESSASTSRMTYQVGIDGNTEAGTYQTTLIYTVTPTF